MKLAGRTAIVTGAAGGIGRAVATSLATRGCHLALSDIDEVGLAETVRSVSSRGLRVSAHRLDVADAAAIAAFPEAVRAVHASVDVLVNNAGVALAGTFEQLSERDFEWLFDINFWGVVRMIRAFLPTLRKSDDARLVNLSSLFGLIAPPGQTAYSASKFAVRGFSESLRRELADTSVGVTVVHPGGVATSIAKSARMPAGATGEEVAREMRRWTHLLKLPAERAGETIVRGVERRQARIVVGNDAKLAAIIERIAPVSYWELMGPKTK
jgi:NAD(P)-dependent dehydrogenase (short-subunit alcohol dehydrogenase family)